MEIYVEVQDEAEAQAIQMILVERRRQDRLFGEQRHDPAWWMTIMGEEYGETCKAVCDWRWGKQTPNPIGDIKAEASQVAAVGVAMIQVLIKGNWVDQITTAKPSDRRTLSMALDEDQPDYTKDDPDEAVATVAVDA
jgi:hypothetical protein